MAPPERPVGFARLRRVGGSAVGRARLATTTIDPVRSREVRPMLRRLELDGEVSALDVGCAFGVWTNHLARRVRRAVGVDVDSDTIAFGRHLYPRADLRVADARELPFGDGEFDRVVFISTLEHIDRPEGALAEVARVLRPGGLLALSADTLDHPAWESLRDLHAQRSFVEQYFTRASLLALAERAGFEALWGRYLYGSSAATVLLRPRLKPTNLHWLVAPAVRVAGAVTDDPERGMIYQAVLRRRAG